MKNALAERIERTLTKRLYPEADSYLAAHEAMMELGLVANILENGIYLGNCPYCGRGAFYNLKAEGVVNIAEPGKDGCCCRDLVKQV
jgi:hypothetical protein